MGSSPTVIIHSLEHARAVLAAAREARCRVTLESASGAGLAAGAAWFVALLELARGEFTEVGFEAVLDCGDEAGAALGALRAGVRRIRFRGSEEAARRLAGIAAELGATIENGTPQSVLDLLGTTRPDEAARAFLAGNGAAR